MPPTSLKTLFEAYTGKWPNIEAFRVLSSPVIAKLPGKHPAKLHPHTSRGTFLGYTATERNIYYQEHQTKWIKIATHVSLNEAAFTLPKTSLSPT
jgi:hypothetical protein